MASLTQKTCESKRRRFTFPRTPEITSRTHLPQLFKMPYFTWKEAGLTSDCASLEAMASRFEEAASLMRRMAQQGFEINSKGRQQQITHSDADVFESWGFVNEEPAFRQLTLISDPSTQSPAS